MESTDEDTEELMTVGDMSDNDPEENIKKWKPKRCKWNGGTYRIGEKTESKKCMQNVCKKKNGKAKMVTQLSDDYVCKVVSKVYFFVTTAVLYFGPHKFLPLLRDNLPVSQTRNGLLRGQVWKSRDSRDFFAYRGIAYAKPPIGHRRFRRTEALDETDNWKGIKDANSEIPLCYQSGLLHGTVDVLGLNSGREDCLYLNVYTPSVKPASLLPVMVFIHGGGFVVGDATSSSVGPAFFMDGEEDVVLVSLAYRLGIFGFFSLENDDVPGNQGLWDQREALIWVKRNIRAFGGDPARVTLFGESAGSMSVNFHILSPQSGGLFQSAIMQSGTAISPYTKLNKPPRHYADKLAEAVGCTKDGKEDVLTCLQEKPAWDLQNQLFMFDEDSLRRDLGLTFPGPWVPVVDDFSGKPFLPKSPETILQVGEENKVAVMLGFTSEDGLLYTTKFLADHEKKNQFFKNWDESAAINLLGKEKSEINEDDVAFVNMLKEKYAKNVQNITFKEITNLFTDAIFAESTHKLAKILSTREKPVYKYIFAYKGTNSLADIISASGLFDLASVLVGFKQSQNLGACHADELLYLFNMIPFVDMIPNEMDKNVSRHMVNLWINFATFGNPNGPGNSEWVRGVSSAEFSYYVIDSNPGMQTIKELERFKYWNT